MVYISNDYGLWYLSTIVANKKFLAGELVDNPIPKDIIAELVSTHPADWPRYMAMR